MHIPSDSFSSHVRVESRYGTISWRTEVIGLRMSFCDALRPRSFLERVLMTLPSMRRDLLITLASRNRSPDVPEVSLRSLPARSTRLILDSFNSRRNTSLELEFESTPGTEPELSPEAETLLSRALISNPSSSAELLPADWCDFSCLRLITKIAWLREESAFIRVAAVVLLAFPAIIMVYGGRGVEA